MRATSWVLNESFEKDNEKKGCQQGSKKLRNRRLRSRQTDRSSRRLARNEAGAFASLRLTSLSRGENLSAQRRGGGRKKKPPPSYPGSLSASESGCWARRPPRSPVNLLLAHDASSSGKGRGGNDLSIAFSSKTKWASLLDARRKRRRDPARASKELAVRKRLSRSGGRSASPL